MTSKTGGIREKDDDEGCTKYPVKCSFSNTNKFIVNYIDENSKSVTLKFDETKDTYKKLSELNSRNDIDYIKVEIPDSFLNESNQYLKKVVLIDMVGVPDKNLKLSLSPYN